MASGALAVPVGDLLSDGCVEVIGIEECAVSEMMTLQVAPRAFDVIELGRIARQPPSDG